MARPYTYLASRVLFPVHEWVKGHSTSRYLRFLERSQWWSPTQLERHRVERLRLLLTDAVSHVPYYRRVFKELKYDPRGLTAVSELRALPFLTKAVVRASFGDLTAENGPPLKRSNTGGSSGEPLVFMVGRERVSHDVAGRWRATRWWGLDIGDPEIVVWGSPIEIRTQGRAQALRDRVFRTELLSAFEMSDAKLDTFVQRVRARRPKMLFGYPSALSLIARHSRKREIPMRDLGVKVAFVTAERLYDDQREDIASIFGCDVANGYGGRDAGFVAHECPSGGMHLSAEDIIVELVDEQGSPVPPGNPGEVVVTHLATRGFPFVRYRTGDIAIFDDRPCACGRSLPLLREIQGRATDFVVAQDGTTMHGLALIYVLRDLPGIAAFKIVQETMDSTRVLLQPAPDFDPKCVDVIQRGLRARLGAGVRVVVDLLPELPPDHSGKFRYVVSNLSGRHHTTATDPA